MSPNDEQQRRLCDAAIRAIDEVFAIFTACPAQASEPADTTVATVAAAPALTPAAPAHGASQDAELLDLWRSTLRQLIREGRLTSSRTHCRRLLRAVDVNVPVDQR